MSRAGRGKPGQRASVALAAVLAIALLGCGGGEAAQETAPRDAGEQETSGSGRLQIATTVAPITNIVASVVGDRADITGIVSEGTNSHTFEPEPSVAELLSRVDVVYINGLLLEEPTKDLAEANLAEGAEVVELGTLSIPEEEYAYDFSFPEEDGKPNPHLWTDPRYAAEYARIVAQDLSERDSDNADYYQDNAEAFAELVDGFDAAMRESFATIPQGQRKLLTYHDAYAYFARDYDWEVIGRSRSPTSKTPPRVRSPSSSSRSRQRASRRPSARRCSPARCSSRSVRRPGWSTSMCSATTTCPVSPGTPSTAGWD